MSEQPQRRTVSAEKQGMTIRWTVRHGGEVVTSWAAAHLGDPNPEHDLELNLRSAHRHLGGVLDELVLVGDAALGLVSVGYLQLRRERIAPILSALFENTVTITVRATLVPVLPAT